MVSRGDPEPVYATTLLVGQLALQVLGPDPLGAASKRLNGS